MSEVPPVADTYYDLQSIAAIETIYRQAEKERTSTAVTMCVLYASLDLMFLNVADLVNRNTRTWGSNGVANQDQRIAKRQLWIRELLEICHQLAAELHVMTYECDERAVVMRKAIPGFAFELMANRIEVYSEAVRQKLDDAYVKSELIYSTQFNVRANIVHMLKVNFHNLRCVASNLDSSSVPDAFVTHEYEELIRDAASYPDAYQDTFLQQFCLLHQVPELLSRQAIVLIRSGITAAQKNPAEAIGAFQQADRLVGLSRNCLRPLVHELLPYDYGEIRAHLGVTSGSHSQKIAKTLLHEVVVELADLRSRMEAMANPSPQHRRVATLAFRVFDGLHQWRELHVHLPRNVLGVGNVRSLVGSEEAVTKAQNLSQFHYAVAAKHGLRLTRIPAFAIDGRLVPAQFAEVDTHLLAITGAVTKARFPDVQERSGRYSKPPKIVDDES